MDAKAYLTGLMGKVLEMKGLDLFVKAGLEPRTRIAGSLVVPVTEEKVTEEMVVAIAKTFLNSHQQTLL